MQKELGGGTRSGREGSWDKLNILPHYRIHQSRSPHRGQRSATHYLVLTSRLQIIFLKIGSRGRVIFLQPLHPWIADQAQVGSSFPLESHKALLMTEGFQIILNSVDFHNKDDKYYFWRYICVLRFFGKQRQPLLCSRLNGSGQKTGVLHTQTETSTATR